MSENNFPKYQGLMIGYPESAVIQGTLNSIQKHCLQHEILDANEIKKRFPVFNPKSDEIGILEVEAGYLVPELCIMAYQDIATEKYNAELHYEETMKSWSKGKDNLYFIDTEVTLNNNEKRKNVYCTKKLILCVGAWAPELYGSEIPLKLHVERRVLFWFEPENEFVQLFKVFI